MSHLSVLKNKNFVGIVSEDDLLNQVNLSKTLTELFDHLPRTYVYEKTHIYDILMSAAKDHLSIVPVLDEDENFLGNIDVRHLLYEFAKMGSISEQGGIIVLEMSEADYSLAYISQVVEAENAKVLNAFISSKPSSNKLELTLKINRLELGSIIKALERYNYSVKASFQKDSYHDDLKDRYDELMNYLNL